MPATIVQSVNNTSHTLHYHNHATEHKCSLDSKSDNDRENGLIPCTTYEPDDIPVYSSAHGAGIIITLDSVGVASIMIYDQLKDAGPQLSVIGCRDYSAGKSKWTAHGKLSDSDQLILRMDEVDDGLHKYCRLMFYTYEEKYKVTDDHISLKRIQEATPCTGQILLTIKDS